MIDHDPIPLAVPVLQGVQMKPAQKPDERERLETHRLNVIDYIFDLERYGTIDHAVAFEIVRKIRKIGTDDE